MLRKKIDLLLKPVWTTRDIMAYFKVGRDKATRMKEEVILKGNGAVPLSDYEVFTDTCIKMFCNHSVAEEMEILKNACLAYEKK